MKDFDEAMDLICRRIESPDPNSAENKRIEAEMTEMGDRYRDIIIQIQSDPKVHTFAHIIIDAMEDGLGPCIMMCIMFAHGLAVGMEMNKSDEPTS